MNICNRIVRDKYVNKIFQFNCVKHTFEMNSKENVSERVSIKMAYLYLHFCQFGFVLFLFFCFLIYLIIHYLTHQTRVLARGFQQCCMLYLSDSEIMHRAAGNLAPSGGMQGYLIFFKQLEK